MVILTCVMYGEFCKKHTRFVGLYETREAAQKMIDDSIETAVQNYGNDAVVLKERNEVWASKDDVNVSGYVFDIFEINSNIFTGNP